MKISDRVRLSETRSSNPGDQGFYTLSGRVLLALISDAIVWANGLLLTKHQLRDTQVRIKSSQLPLEISGGLWMQVLMFGWNYRKPLIKTIKERGGGILKDCSQMNYWEIGILLWWLLFNTLAGKSPGRMRFFLQSLNQTKWRKVQPTSG